MAAFPMITAHSGCMGTLDNTMESVEAGIRLGADVVEEDIRVTRDGVPILAHDDHVRSVDGTWYSLSQMTYAEAQTLTVAVEHNGAVQTMKLLRLEDIMPLIASSGVKMNLDLKADESIESTADLIHRYGLSQSVYFSGCERDRALMVQRLCPGLPKLLNAEQSLFAKVPYEAAMRQTCLDALKAECVGVNIHYGLVRQQLIEYAASLGLPLYVWTVNDPLIMEEFIDMGVFSITTRNVQALVELKNKRTRSSGNET
ncbi:glycerophosphodiester phosphodiesterase [Paenibacillus silviterrae]|uniref:glycerophosphodiester phosphodiesterase n=1 Tax=Paenibacillus silviterrae TaxID=3242194 RepID=UPI002543DD77|nr:glycerophosphodiester phosphodiesterase [Paenibacillus chinjuensis]